MRCTGCGDWMRPDEPSCVWCQIPAPDRTVRTVEQITLRLDAIREATGRANDDGCHIDQDALLLDVLKAIADGADQPALLARHVLEVTGIDFSRWYG